MSKSSQRRQFRGMQCHSFHIKGFVRYLAVAVALIACCCAQEVAYLDLTKVSPHLELRRPSATSPMKAARGYNGIESAAPCFSTHKEGKLEASLLTLDRIDYQPGDAPIFEVRVQNVGSSLLTIPFSPDLSDLQTEPAKKFSYLELDITLWIASGQRWSSSTGGQVSLYGARTHPGTVLVLHPGEWVRVIGKGRLDLPGRGSVTFHEELHPLWKEYPPDHMYAEASLYHNETLITATQSATVRREVCLWKDHGQTAPVRLTVP